MPTTIHEAEYLRLVAMLRDLRRRAGLRQADLAERLGVPQSFVSKYETGERRIDVLELKRICEALGSGLLDFVERFEGTK